MLDEIAAQYGLAVISDHFRLGHGRENVSFRATFGDEPLVVRQLRARGGLPRLEAEHAFMQYLSAAGLCVPAPLTAKKGATFVLVDGGPFAVYRLGRGKRFQRGNLTHARSGGRVLARYHGLAAQYPRTIVSEEGDFRSAFLGAAARAKAAVEHLEKTADAHLASIGEYLRKRLPGIVDGMVRLDYTALPVVTIHGDYRRANLLVGAGKVSALLDFDRCRLEARVLDVAMGVSSLARGADKREFMAEELARAFVGGYRSEGALTGAEMACLPLVVEARTALSALTRAARFSDGGEVEVPKRARKLTKYVDRLRWLESNDKWRDALKGDIHG